MALDNPIDAYLRASEMKQRNRQQAQQDAMGIGESLGGGVTDIVQQIQAKKQKEQWGKTINSLLQDPNASPQMKQILPMLAQRPELAGQLLPGAMKAKSSGTDLTINPDGSMSISGVPLGGQPPQPQKPAAPPMTAGVGGATTPAGGMPPQLPPPSRPTAHIPLSGNKAAELLTKSVGKDKPTYQQDLRKQFIDAMNRKTDVFSRSLDIRQIDNLAKATGLQPTVVKGLQQNNIRADRAIAILDDPKATWAALNGWVSTDFAGMMQGGAPQKEQILESQFPNWKAKLSQMQTYVSSHPEGPIDPGFRDYMRHFVKGVKEIDNDYLWKNAAYQGNMIGPTIRGGSPYVKKSLDYTKDFMKGGKPLASEPKAKTAWTPEKEQRYQELLRRQQSAAQ